MSERSEEHKITSVVKPKDPRKVAAGKRLAAMSKQAKQAKKEAQAQAEHKLADDSASENTSINNVGLMVSVIGTVVGVVGLYYMYCPAQAQTESEAEKPDHSSIHTSTVPTVSPKVTTQAKTSKTKLDSFD